MKNKKEETKKYNPDLTKEDRDILNEENLHKDGGVDEQLRDRKRKVDFTGEDLDIPGQERAKKGNGTGLNDEENKLHSQGGPAKDNLKEQDGTL
tara:strand:- start:1891 stop:2172 length:282 start_codon:yes stop_codon:yes gene_type:complete